MKRIAYFHLSLLLVLTGLWLAADAMPSPPQGFWAWRESLVNYTGIIAIGAMSVALLLAIRPARFESFFGGLDKMYRLHKWLGITGLVASIVHWLWTDAPKWMVGWGWLDRPVRGAAPAELPPVLFEYFRQQRGLAESIGEWAFYAAVLLIVLALVRRFPYRHFFRVHRLLAVVYLLLVFHAVVLMKFDYWDHTLGFASGLLLMAGAAAALFVLFKRVGRTRQAVGEVESAAHHADTRVLEVAVRLHDRWPGHEAGQFAFVTFDAREGPHPFTISSPWTGDGRMLFLIKELGDYTRKLPADVKVGDLVKVEGPYGRFDFRSPQPRQIWIAGGIGITPFVARMKQLAMTPGDKTVDLFYSIAAASDDVIDRVQRDADAAKVRLHLMIGARDGLLDAQRVIATVPDWKFASVWFCGPAGFAKAMREGLTRQGLSGDDFHQELFAMR